MPLRATLLGLSAAAACTVAPPRDVLFAATAPQEPADTTGEGHWGERTIVEASVIPIAELTRDFDGLHDDARSEDATGWGVRAAVGDHERSAGVLFQSLRSDDGLLDADVVSFDFDVRTSLESEAPMLWLRAGAGVGFAWLDTRALESTSELSTQLRVGLDFEPSPHFVIGASLGGILFGSPGDTEAYGTFFSAGVALVF
jgi:hypothetical protein